jgi:hypothetical protein
MDNYVFNEKDIVQHTVKYGVDIRPTILVNQEKTRLQDYCNWLTTEFPQLFETLLIGPNEFRIQKKFLVGSKLRLELPTLTLTPRGPLFIVPIKMQAEENYVEEFAIHDRDHIFRCALGKLRGIFVNGKVLRVGVIHELIFDTGATSSVDLVSSMLAKEVWKRGIKNIRLHLENPRDDKNINVDITPALQQRVEKIPTGLVEQNVGYGINVKLDINNTDMTRNLENEEVSDILAFAEDYMKTELIKFLNGEEY